MTKIINNKNFSIKWVVALKSEANFLINFFNMKLLIKKNLFPIYCNSDSTHCLIISGIGKVNSAAATVYLSQNTILEKWTFWVNIGVGGHKLETYGKLFVIDKITEFTNKNLYYPSFQFKNIKNRASLLTLDKPETIEYDDQIYDMEGAGFFNIANKITQKEFIVLIKIISDTPSNNIIKLNNKVIEKLFVNNEDVIKKIIKELEIFSLSQMKKNKKNEIYNFITLNWKFSFTEEKQLEFIIRRLNAAKKTKNLKDELKFFSNSDQILNYLKKKLNKIEIDWEKN